MRCSFIQYQKMSLTIIKAGLLDTLQDEGRFGFGASGINPGGVMDVFSAGLANCLLGKRMNRAVLEIHFPAPVILFNEAAIICITGADFSASIDHQLIRINQPLLVNKGVILSFKKLMQGARCYLSLFNDLVVTAWLNSYSTNLKAAAGGLRGAALKTGDVIPFTKIAALYDYAKGQQLTVLPWLARPPESTAAGKIEVIKGSEWEWLDEESQQTFLAGSFKMTSVADRMAYRLWGTPLRVTEQQQLVSSAVTFGTVQVLPSGQVILLMADHPTTGGYPKLASVISAHLPVLAQSKPGDTFSFSFTDVATAEQKLLQQFNYLQRVQYAACFNMEKLLQ